MEKMKTSMYILFFTCVLKALTAQLLHDEGEGSIAGKSENGYTSAFTKELQKVRKEGENEDEGDCVPEGETCAIGGNSLGNCCHGHFCLATCLPGYKLCMPNDYCLAEGEDCTCHDNCCDEFICNPSPVVLGQWICELCSDPTTAFEGKQCFSSLVNVSVKGKNGKVPISEIQVGDKVLTAGGEYQSVYSIDHFDPKHSAKFLQIYTAPNYYDDYDKKEGKHLEGATPLEVTPRHMVFLNGRPNPIPASAVKVGDFLQTTDANKPRLVTKISSVVREGVYNPLTIDGTIVVDNDVVTSIYSAFVGEDDESEYIEILGGYKIMTHQNFFHTILKPYKYLCTGISLELCRTEEERSGIGRFGTIVYRHWSKQDKFIQNLLLTLVIVVTIIMDIIIMNPYCLITTLLLLIVSLLKGQKKKL